MFHNSQFLKFFFCLNSFHLINTFLFCFLNFFMFCLEFFIRSILFSFVFSTFSFFFHLNATLFFFFFHHIFGMLLLFPAQTLNPLHAYSTCRLCCAQLNWHLNTINNQQSRTKKPSHYNKNRLKRNSLIINLQIQKS